VGEIIESTRRHYIGADADKDLIPAGGKAFGDSYHANDKGKQYYWNGANWKTGLGYEYVPRDAPAADFAIGDFPIKDAYQADGLDLTGIVPAGAVAVHIVVKIRGTAAGLTFGIRANATTKVFNRIEVLTQVANVFTSNVDCLINIDADRLVDYYHATNMNIIEVVILGWCI